MKVKLLSRNPSEYCRETKQDIHKVFRNYDPALHPFETNREYGRAMNATKLERTFAKPFIGNLAGHSEGVKCLCKNPQHLSQIVSGAYDGEVKVWNLLLKRCCKTLNAHQGLVNGICYNTAGTRIFTCGSDSAVKVWNIDDSGNQAEKVVMWNHPFLGVDHHHADNQLVTCGQDVQVWNSEKLQPIRDYKWGLESVTSIKFNKTEVNLVGATANDRSIILYDIRQNTPLRKVIQRLCSNAICWNPMKPYLFTVANEDFNLYSYDIRRLNEPVGMHYGHVQAVTSLDYSPTGQEFVSAGYDKTLRIFPSFQSQSREIYHTKRMQRVISCLWTLDDKFILCGSDEMNIRMWKARSFEKFGPLKPREKVAFAYNEKLKKKFQDHPKIAAIGRRRSVPKHVQLLHKEHYIMQKSRERKRKNIQTYNKKNVGPTSVKKSAVVKVEV